MVAAIAVAALIVLLNLAAYPLAEPFATLWQLLAYASLTLVLWIATGGRRPLAALVAVIAFGALAQTPFLAAAAAFAVAATLFVLQVNCLPTTPPC